MSDAVRSAAVLAVLVAAGALGSLVAGAATGMPPGDLVHLVVALLPAAAVTIAVALAARPLFSRFRARHVMIAAGAAGALAAVANVAVLAWLMFLDRGDAVHVAVLLAYAVGVGVAAGLALTRSWEAGLARLADRARALADGDLDARVGPVDGPLELRQLAGTLDATAARLEASQARERQLEARRRDLIAAASHDLRTPLAALKAMVHAVEDGVVERPDDLRRYAAEMQRSVDSLAALVDDLFLLAQLDAAGLEGEAADATLGEVVDRALAAVSGQAAHAGVRLEVAVGAPGAACSPRLARVLQNLLGNAVRHTPPGGVVTVRAAASARGIELSVEDTGEGLDRVSLERAFDPFWRADPARSGPGAGLGLTLARRIVEALGGRIEAEPAPARGARFAVVVPTR